MRTRSIPFLLSLTAAAACSSSSTNDAGTNDASIVGDTATSGNDAAVVVDTSIESNDATATGSETGTGTDAATPADAAVATDGPPMGDAAVDPRFSCVPTVTLPTNIAPGAGSVVARMRDFQTSANLVGLTVKLCTAADITCATPTSMGTTDANGLVTLTYTLAGDGYYGYFEVTGGSGTNAVVPSRIFARLTTPTPGTTDMPYNLIVVSANSFGLLRGVLSAQFDDTHGAIAFISNDCAGMPAAGISLSSSPSAGNSFYFAGLFPSRAGTMTDGSGQAGFVNTAPGTYTVTASLAENNGRIGSTTVSVRGAYLTSGNIFPSPPSQ